MLQKPNSPRPSAVAPLRRRANADRRDALASHDLIFPIARSLGLRKLRREYE
jgi:hypothetical protein